MPKLLAYIADDCQTALLGLQLLLQAMGLSVLPWDNGNDLIHACTVDVPDIVITDLCMMGGDGSDILTQCPGIPTIVITAATRERMPAIAKLARLAGALDVLRKGDKSNPARIRAILHALRTRGA